MQGKYFRPDECWSSKPRQDSWIFQRFLASLWTETKSRSLNTQKMENWRGLFCGQEEFFSRDPERARWAHLANSGSQSEYSILFILPVIACNVTYPLRTHGETPVPSRPITMHYPYSYSDFSRSGGTYKQTLGRWGPGYEINLNPGREIIMPLIFPNGSFTFCH